MMKLGILIYFFTQLYCIVGKSGDIDELVYLAETLLEVVNGSFKVSITYLKCHCSIFTMQTADLTER
jgi:hypothetical protein